MFKFKSKFKSRVKAPKGEHHVKTLRVHVTRAARAFTLIELLVVIAIIGLLATLSVIALSNARAKSRDSKRLADIKQLQTSLEMYFDQNDHYPTKNEFDSGTISYYSSSIGTTTYMKIVPSAPAPNDGSCSTAGNDYIYTPSADGSSYTISFCIGGSSNHLAAGPKCATPGGILSIGCDGSGGNQGGGDQGGQQPQIDCNANPAGCSWHNVGAAGFSGAWVQYISSAVANGTPYVAYSDYRNSLNGNATVMKFNGTAWVNVGNAGFSEGLVSYTSLAFNSGVPYVAYQDSAAGYGVTVMKYNGSSWVNVGAAGFSITQASSISLAFDGDVPYVAYTDAGNDGSYKATVMKFNGSSWIGVGSPGFSAYEADYISLAFVDGTPYVAYSDYGSDESYKATVMKFNNSSSSWELVGAAGFSAGEADDISLAIDNGTPYVAYRDYGNGLDGKATVMKYNGSWEPVGAAGFSAGEADYTSLAFDNGTPYVAYSDYGNSPNGNATVMKFDGTAWVNVGNAGFSAAGTANVSLAFDNGTPYVAYQDAGYAATVMTYGQTPPPCVPDCSGKACGDNGCGGSCGACTGYDTCGGGGTNNQCGCTPESDLAFCSNIGATCGSQTNTDNCGNTRTVANCGACTLPQTCGGGGNDNQCGCTSDCAGKACGAADSCGGFCSSGACTGYDTCGGGGVANQCGCTAETDNAFCSRLGAACGSKSGTDNCGHSKTVADCGAARGTSCTGYNTCGAVSPNQCGCTPDCSGKACGASDGCGGLCSSGSCTSPQTCGGGGTTNVCGCTADCSGKACGAADSCGGFCSAGSCPSGQVCGLHGVANQCSPVCDSPTITVATIAGHACNTGTPDYDTCAYDTVSIGNQCWFRQNLNIGTIVTGATTQSNNSPTPILEKYCYNNNYTNCQSQGGLYQWDEAMQYSTAAGAQGICPIGWHIPTHDNWTALERAVCTSGTCATDFPYDLTTDGVRGTNEGSKLSLFISGGTNSSGFTGLLAGNRDAGGGFSSRGWNAYLWSSSVSGTSAWYRNLFSGNATVDRYTIDRAFGFSVRCLQD